MGSDQQVQRLKHWCPISINVRIRRHIVGYDPSTPIPDLQVCNTWDLYSSPGVNPRIPRENLRIPGENPRIPGERGESQDSWREPEYSQSKPHDSWGFHTGNPAEYWKGSLVFCRPCWTPGSQWISYEFCWQVLQICCISVFVGPENWAILWAKPDGAIANSNVEKRKKIS